MFSRRLALAYSTGEDGGDILAPPALLKMSGNSTFTVHEALVAEVQKRAGSRAHAPIPAMDLPFWTRRKLTPMVNGFFPKAEREAVFRLLEKSVVFVTSENIERVLLGQTWSSTARDLANLYLSSVGADLLTPDAPSLLGLSEETTCYVSADYFLEREGIEDVVLHEAAHVFHNCKRKTAGLPETRTSEWLLPIEFRRRETFAYACEAYGWIVERSSDKATRVALGERLTAEEFGGSDERVDASEVADIVQEACRLQNGWKVILARCAPEPPRNNRTNRPCEPSGTT